MQTEQHETNSNAPESASDTLRRLARDKRAEAEALKSARDPQRFSMSERDVREMLEEAEALEAEAAHDEERASEPRLAEVPRPSATLYSVDRSDSSGFCELSFSALRERVSQDEALSPSNLGRLFVLVLDCASGSDYSGGGALGKSNAQALRELCEESGLVSGLDFWSLSGSHGSYGVALRASARSAAVAEMLSKLEGYPVADEDGMSEAEHDEEQEAWESYVSSDFQRALESEHDLDLSACDFGALFELFCSACDSTNTYWEHNCEGASIDCDRVAAGVSKAQALALEGAARSAEALEAEAEAAAQLEALREPLALAQAELSKPSEQRDPDTLVDAIDSARQALGSPSQLKVRDAIGVLSQVAQWPVASEGPALDCDPAELRAQLSRLRRHVGETIRAARETLEALAPERFQRDSANFRALPVETPER